MADFEGVIQTLRLLRLAGQEFHVDFRDDGSIVLIVGPAAKNAQVIKRSVAGQTVPAGGQASKEARKATTRKGRSSRKQKSAEPESAAGPGDLAEKIMAALNEEENKAGLNLKELARAVGVRKKTKIKPAIDDFLTAEKIIKVAGGKLRRADVTIKRGAPPLKEREKKAGGKGGGKTSKTASRGAGKKAPKGRKNKPSEKQLAAAAKARAALAAKRAKGAGKEKPAKNATAKAAKASKPAKGKRGRKKASAAKSASSKKKPAVNKKPAKKSKKGKKAIKLLPPSEKTDTSGQIPREATRVATEAAEAKTE